MADPASQPVEPGPARPVHEAPASSGVWNIAGIAVRLVLTLVGAAGLIVSAFLNWVGGIDGVDLNIRSLFQDSAIKSTTGTFVETVGFAAIVVGLVAIIGLSFRSGWLTRFAGAIGIAGFVLFAIQVYRADLAVGDIQTGGWFALAGSIVALVGGFLGTRTTVVAPTGPALVSEP
jgi:hypothetical protein